MAELLSHYELELCRRPFEDVDDFPVVTIAAGRVDHMWNIDKWIREQMKYDLPGVTDLQVKSSYVSIDDCYRSVTVTGTGMNGQPVNKKYDLYIKMVPLGIYVLISCMSREWIVAEFPAVNLEKAIYIATKCIQGDCKMAEQVSYKVCNNLWVEMTLGYHRYRLMKLVPLDDKEHD